LPIEDFRENKISPNYEINSIQVKKIGTKKKETCIEMDNKMTAWHTC
jgi:hypothetical protein